MIRLLLSAAFVFLLVSHSQPPAPRGEVRFHHVHYRVGDPATAMNETAVKLQGRRVVVSGLGVGVRVADQFVLYDRLDETDPPDLVQRSIEHAYAAAADWLKSRGVLARPGTFAASPIAGAPPARYHHIGFAAADYDGIVARIAATPLKQTTESALFDAGGGLLVEIAREPDLPDAFWCPMHPDVRSGTQGRCPVCRMDLVPMPAPAVGEYRMDVTLARGPRGVEGMRLAVREPDTNALVRSFTTVHEKTLHLFIVSRDLEYFAHVHPEQRADGSFHLNHPLPPGEYMLIADFLPANATTQMIQRAVIVPPSPSPSPSPSASADKSTVSPSAAEARFSRPVGDLRVSLKTENLVAGKEGRLTFTVTDARTGAPVTDLEPYLGAPAHMLLVRSDLSDAVHEHPEEAATGGPTISFHPVMPAAGAYKLWIQFQRGGRVLTFPFDLRAE